MSFFHKAISSFRIDPQFLIKKLLYRKITAQKPSEAFIYRPKKFLADYRRLSFFLGGLSFLPGRNNVYNKIDVKSRIQFGMSKCLLQK